MVDAPQDREPLDAESQRIMWKALAGPGITAERATIIHAAVERVAQVERRRVGDVLDQLALTMVSHADDVGTALTASILQKAAAIAREMVPSFEDGA